MESPLVALSGELLDLSVEFASGDAQEISLVVRGVPVTYDVVQQSLACRGKKAACKPADGRIRLRVLVDRASVKIFANGGRLYLPMGVVLDPNDRTLALRTRGGEARLLGLEARELKSAWP